MVELLKFGNGLVTLSRILLGMWLFIYVYPMLLKVTLVSVPFLGLE